MRSVFTFFWRFFFHELGLERRQFTVNPSPRPDFVMRAEMIHLEDRSQSLNTKSGSEGRISNFKKYKTPYFKKKMLCSNLNISAARSPGGRRLCRSRIDPVNALPIFTEQELPQNSNKGFYPLHFSGICFSVGVKKLFGWLNCYLFS